MILLSLLIALAHPPCYGDGHNLHRSRSALNAFRKAHPCPGGPDKGSVKRCHGYVIDHIIALECCGLDLPCNMQWQSKARAKAKDRWEGLCARAARRVRNRCARPEVPRP